MELFVAAVISGVSVGLLYGLLGFSIVVLYRATGTLSFAQSNIAMVITFATYLLFARGELSSVVAILCGVILAALLGGLLYGVIIWPRPHGGNLNIVLRTLALYTLLFETANILWAAGQPFQFSALPTGSPVHIGSAVVSTHTFVVIAVVTLLGGGLSWFFQRTRAGLLFRAVADRQDVARILGVRPDRISMLAWVIASVLALATGLMTAPVSFVSTDMMSSYVLYAFAGAMLGGLTSWTGVFIGGVIVGITSNVVTVYSNGEWAVVAVFVLLLACLVLRPQGILGKTAAVRL